MATYVCKAKFKFKTIVYRSFCLIFCLLVEVVPLVIDVICLFSVAFVQQV